MALDMFLKLDEINGDSQNSEHKDEIDVLVWSWGTSQPATTHSGAGRAAGKVEVQDLSVTKFIDRASPELLKRTFTGEHIADATLTVVAPGLERYDVLVMKFEHILVSSVSTGGSSGEDRLTENITLNFRTVTYAYTELDGRGVKDEIAPVSWDMAKDKEL